MTKVTLTFELPSGLARLMIWLVLLYRRSRYGYAFRRIPLTQGRFAIVDPGDYEHLSRYQWRLCKMKGKDALYAERSIRRADGKYSRILMHRQLIRPPDGYVIDHINGSGLDNRRANLRLATAAQNAWNAGKRGGRSGYKGVWLAKDKGLWRAAIVCHGRRRHLGYFKDKREAARAYDRAAREYHGRRRHLGYFRDKREAAMAYDRAAREYHGRFAVLNFQKTRTGIDTVAAPLDAGLTIHVPGIG